jgi:AbrB family looped-hinge helix DNA binding protein
MKVRNTTAKITSKGQITIPKAVRDELGVSAGDSLRFRVEDGSAVVTPVRKRKLTDFVGIFAVPDDHPAAVKMRELRAKYSGQELVRKIKDWEREAVSEAAAESDERVKRQWRKPT